MKKSHLSLLLAVVGSLTPINAHADAIYVSNRSGRAIEQFGANGTGTAFATNGLTSPEGLAVDTTGNLYVADDVQSKIYKFTPCGDGSVFFSNPNLLRTPEGLVVDSAGNLYVASYGNNTIIKITPDGTGSVFATDPGNHSVLSGPIGLAFDSAGNLYAANAGNNRITKFTPGGVGSVFSTNNLSYPSGIAFDSTGNLYVANQTSYTISRFTPDGGSSVFANTNNGINWLTAVAFDSADNLYVVNYGNNKLLKFTPGGVGSTFASTNLSGPTFIAIQGAPLPSLPSLPGSASFTYNNFADPTGLQFNGNVAPANTCDGPILQLTASAASQAGSAFTATPIPLASNAAFSTFFTFRLSKPGGAVDSDGVQGGDGIAFVIASQSRSRSLIACSNCSC
jgi:sugar lactone lactonase YvrE